MKRYAGTSIVCLLPALALTARTVQADPPRLGDVVAVALAQRLDDRDASVRQEAVLALHEMGPMAKAAIPALTRRLGDEDCYVAADAAHCLDSLGSEAAANVVPLLWDYRPRVRKLAAQTLGRIGADAKAAVPALAQHLSDCDASVRQEIVLALRMIVLALRMMGPDAIGAIPALAQRLRDEDQYVAVDAAQTLAKLGPVALPAIVPMLEDRAACVRDLAALTIRQIAIENKANAPRSGF